jgi:type VI secretion system protein ImpJ
MTVRNRQSPAWYEGMTLDPHHFQQWDRHHRYEMHMRARSVLPLDWGFLGLDIDRETLANGQFSLRACRGITQDGFFFDCPGNHRLPQSQGVKEHFSPSADRVKVFLALPAEHANGRTCQLLGSADDRQIRFAVETLSISDENTGSDEREISVCQPNFRIVFGDEPLDEYTVLQVAEIVRTPEGEYSLSNKFIPPCLSISASENLVKITRSVLELLIAKSDALSERRRQQPSGQIEFTTADVTLLGVLQTINSFIPLLRYHFTLGTCHPETLYSLFASLAGQLMTFSSEQEMRPADLPSYDHGNSSECFVLLAGKITQLLDTVLSANFIRIPLEKQTESQWVGRILDHGLLTSAHFYIAASGELPERKLVDELPLRMKVGGADDIKTLVSAALPGLPVSHTARPPAGFPSRPGLQYYRLEKTGRLWDSIVRGSSVAIFVPSDFKGIRLELMAVKSS